MKLFQLASYLIDRLVELLHPVVELGIKPARLFCDRPALRITQLHQAPQLAAGLATSVGLGKEPPGQAGCAHHRAGESAGHDGPARSGVAGIVAVLAPGISHGLGVGKSFPAEGLLSLGTVS